MPKTKKSKIAPTLSTLADFPRALEAEEVADLFNISLPMLYKQAKAGYIPSFRIGTTVRFDPGVLADWYKQQ